MNNGTTASKVIANLCGDPKIAEEVAEHLKSSNVHDYIEYIYAISHNAAQEAREGKEVDVLDVLTRIEFFAKEAMETPLRNCDKGTAEEQSRRLAKFCRSHGVVDEVPRCEKCRFLGADNCELKWAQMPYEEGCAK